MRKEPVSWKRANLNIRGEIYIPDETGKPLPGLVICHGIPAKTKGPDDPGYPLLAERVCREGFIVLIFNFRGTGFSEGNFDIIGWASDLEGGLDYFVQRPELDKDRVYLMGFSGGAAVSIYVAAHRQEIGALIACASPAEFKGLMGQVAIDFLEHAREVGIIRDPLFPPSVDEWKKGFETIAPSRWIGEIPPRPLLIIHGTADDVVEVRHAHLLYEKVRGQAELYLVEGAGHRLRVEERAMKKALEWMRKVAISNQRSANG
jgi:putative redox protein